MKAGRLIFLSIICVSNLIACGGSSGGGSSSPEFADPAPIARVDIVGATAVFLVTVPFIATIDDVNVDENGNPLIEESTEEGNDTDPANTDNTDTTTTDTTTDGTNGLPDNVKVVAPTTPGVPRFSSRLYKIDANNQISEAAFFDTDGVQKSFNNNLSISGVFDNLNEGPVDLLEVNDQYILVAYLVPGPRVIDEPTAYNLLIDKATGNVISAPLGITDLTNSGKFPILAESGDYFPANSQFNASDDIYIIGKDFGLTPEQPTVEETEPSADALADTSTVAASPSFFSGSGIMNVTDETTDENTTTDETNNSEQENTDPDNVDSNNEETDSDETDTEEGTSNEEVVEEPDPTAVYRLEINEDGTINLIRISGEEDRPGPGSFVVDIDGNSIYRNEAGGDYSYRVRTREGFTSRIILRTTTLTIGPDGYIYEITNNGVNRIIIREDARVSRVAYAAYPKPFSGLELTRNYRSTPRYNQIQGLIFNNNCDKLSIWQPIYTARATLENPLPEFTKFIANVRERRTVLSANNYYCFGYNDALRLRAYEGPLDDSDVAMDTNVDLDNYDVDFRTLWVFNDSLIYFTGEDRITEETVALTKTVDADVETLLTEAEQGLIIRQYVTLIEPEATTP